MRVYTCKIILNELYCDNPLKTKGNQVLVKINLSVLLIILVEINIFSPFLNETQFIYV